MRTATKQEAINGNSNDTVITPLRLKQVLSNVDINTGEGGGSSNAPVYTAGEGISITNNVISNTITKTSQLTNDSNFITDADILDPVPVNSIWDYEGDTVPDGFIEIEETNIEGDITTNNNSRLKDGKYNVIAVNHRGYSTVAPENTLPAYIMSKEKGFNYVECDVSFTSDGVAVLLHDATIDRTSNGSGSVSDFTYEQLLQYDFGSWKSSEYAGTKIPTFEEFITLCKNIGLHPYIELKSNGNYTQEQIVEIVNMVKKNGMKGNVTYISFTKTYLEYVKQVDRQARLGYLVSNINETIINDVVNLRTGINEAFIDISYTGLTQDAIELCVNNNLPLEIWTVNDTNIIKNMNSYISGVTSDSLIAGQILSSNNNVIISDESDPTVPQHVKEITIEDIEKWNLGVEIEDNVEINDKIKRRWLYNPTTVTPSINVWSLICETKTTDILPKGKYLVIYKASVATGNNGIATFNAGLDGVRLSNSSRSSVPLVNTLTSSGQITYYVEFTEEKTHTIDLYVYTNVACTTSNVEIEFIRVGDIVIGEGITELPIASATTLGGIKVGQNLTISEDGTLNAQAGSSVDLTGYVKEDNLKTINGQSLIGTGNINIEGSTGSGSSEVYSLEETVIGTWLGKTLYRKVINFGALPNKASKRVAHNISNLDILVNIRGIFTNGTATLPLPYAHSTSSSVVALYSSDKTNIQLECGSDRTAYTGYVIIEYTKTTD